MQLFAGKPVLPWVGVPADIEAALERLLGRAGTTGESIQQVDDQGELGAEDDVQRLRDLASEAPVVRIVNRLISRAVESRASDIHIEPLEQDLRVRYRIDGVLREVDAPLQLRAAIISRIKIMARLNIAERRLPQDGRIKLAVRGKDIDLRVATMPTMHGEAVVLRILDRAASRSTSRRSASPALPSPPITRRSPARTASSWSPARPAAARPPLSTPR